MTNHPTSKLFVVGQGELAFLQKLTRDEYYFICVEEHEARQRIRDKLNEVVVDASRNRIAVNLTNEELAFLSALVGEKISIVTAPERAARASLRDRLASAAQA